MFLTSFIVLLVFIFVGCMKQSSLPTIGNNKVDKKTRVAKYKVIIRARWHGFTHQYPNCEGGDCGTCHGICVKRVPKDADGITLSTQEIADGDIYAWVYISEGGQLCMEPIGNIDNGGGTTEITENFDLGDEVASLLGFSSVTIIAGTYTITYSTTYPNGVVCFDIETT